MYEPSTNVLSVFILARWFIWHAVVGSLASVPSAARTVSNVVPVSGAKYGAPGV